MLGSMGVARRDRIAALLLVVLVAALAALLAARRTLRDTGPPPVADARLQRDAVLFDRFTARRERSDEGDRLSVSVRLRTSASVSLPCFVFLLARGEQATPRVWAAWPAQSPGSAVSAGGHFHGATPDAGHAVTLTDSWERITATIPQPPATPFDTVVVYVVDPAGRILLARPFRL
jgi:hypothetical protein